MCPAASSRPNNAEPFLSNPSQIKQATPSHQYREEQPSGIRE
jgi:hypothetical protein